MTINDQEKLSQIQAFTFARKKYFSKGKHVQNCFNNKTPRVFRKTWPQGRDILINEQIHLKKCIVYIYEYIHTNVCIYLPEIGKNHNLQVA